MQYPSREKRGGEKKRETRDAGKMGAEVKAVMFIPYTTGSRLRKNLREAEEKLRRS